MTYTTNTNLFFQINEQQIRDFLKYKTKIYDKEIINDLYQNAAHLIIKTGSLNSFDPTQGHFDTFICNTICWSLTSNRKTRTPQEIQVNASYDEEDTVHMDFILDFNKLTDKLLALNIKKTYVEWLKYYVLTDMTISAISRKYKVVPNTIIEAFKKIKKIIKENGLIV